MNVPASDCATHNGPAMETDAPVWLIKKGGYYYRPNRSGYTREVSAAGRYTRVEADREAAIEPWCMSVEREPEPTIDRVMLALRSARTLIDSLRANDFERYTIAGIADTMDDAERAAIAEYDVVLAQIDEVLK